MPSQILEALRGVFPLEYAMTNSSPRNSFQLNSSFDEVLTAQLRRTGFEDAEVDLPREYAAEYQYDHAFVVPGLGKVVVEVEKADHQKLLYDLLKAHVYLRAGADCVVLLVPTTRGRQASVNSIFDIGLNRLMDCERVGMIAERAASRLFLVGFEQRYRGEGFNDTHRKQMQEECRAYWERQGFHTSLVKPA